MCGRFTLSADPRDLQTRFEIVDTSKVVIEPQVGTLVSAVRNDEPELIWRVG
jgi:putative SOS response-associated peptidase YedK